MSDDWNKKPGGDGADGWVDDDIDPFARTEFGLESVQGPPQQPGHQPPPPQHPQAPPTTQPAPVQHYAPKPKDPYDIDEGKPMALLAHCGILLGLPTFLIPMMQRDNEFALHHSKAAGVNYILFFMLLVFGIVTCGIGLIALPLVYITMIAGIVNAANGDRAGSLALGGLGESIFKLQIKDDDRHLLE